MDDEICFVCGEEANHEHCPMCADAVIPDGDPYKGYCLSCAKSIAGVDDYDDEE